MTIHAALSPSSTTDLSDAQVTFLRDELELSLRSRREQEAALVERVVADGDPIAQAHLVHVRDVLDTIRAALDRAEDGSYGRCVHCSAPIPFERLELVPATDGCVTCLRRLTPWR